ncbi:MAG TPA: WGR domain-containing protein [Rhodanobacteraceae bacterium]|nr:WGR domain-containing protein [Rhodanobacteraceae bacterium]
MHLYMQTPPGGGAVPRYCRIALEQDLLGGWTLYRESGTEGGRATLKREVYLDRDAALAAFEQARDAQLKRGFKVMITQGMENPHG